MDTQAMALHQPHDGPAGAESDVGDAVLRRLDHERQDVLLDLRGGDDARDLGHDVQARHAAGVAGAVLILLRKLGQEVLHRPRRAEGVRNLLQVLDGRLPHGVDRVAHARQEKGLELRLEHLDAEEPGQLRNLFNHALPDAPVVVQHEVLDGVQQGVDQAIHAQRLADEPGVRHDVEPHVVELVLHQVRDEAQELPLRDVAPNGLGNRAQDLGQGGTHGLRRVQAEGLELRQNLLLQLLLREGVRQQETRLDDPHGLLPHLLLAVLQELDEGLHEVRRHDLWPVGLAEGIEVLRHREAHTPGTILCRILDHGDRVLPVLVRVEHLRHDQGRVHAGDADRILRVLLRKLLVDREHVRQQEVLLVADGDQVPHLLRRCSSHHRRVVRAEGLVGLSEPGLLILVREAVGSRQQSARRDARGEEVRLSRKAMERRHQVFGRERGLLLHDATERLYGHVPDHGLLLGREVLQRRDEELFVPVHVLRKHGVLPRDAEEELLIVTEGLLLDHLDHIGDELTHRPRWSQRRGNEVQAIHRAYLDRGALVPNFLFEELQIVEVCTAGSHRRYPAGNPDSGQRSATGPVST
mmetsp:Transcript_58636/g.154461  ORF Transcript_58636/g.154461 Transcript_58636/m.154461 type:complete len:581 (+) Transcript_58636:376-2118(+)